MCFTDKSLEFRTRARRFILGWFKPSILAAERAREEMNASLQTHWPDSPIKVYELIHESWEPPPAVAPPPENHGSDIDWIHNGNGDSADLESISLAESTGARRCGHLPREQILELRRLLGQAIVNGIQGNPKLSRSLTDTAAQFLKDRTIERSRAWTLASAHCLLIAAILTAAIFCTIPPLYNLLSAAPADLWFATAGGLLGAYLSVLQRAGSGEWDAASGPRIHILEVLTKFAAGTLFGSIAFAISQSVHAPASIKAITPDSASLFMFGFAAGLFERLIPKMVSTYSQSYTAEETRKSHDTKSNPDRSIQRKGSNGPDRSAA